MILGCENIAPGIGLTGSWVDNCLMRSDGDQDNASFQGSLTHLTDTGQLSIGQVAAPCSLLELWDDDAHPILSITAAHATDYDPQVQFRTDATDTVKCSMGVDSGDSDKFKIYMGSGIGDTSQFVIDSSGNVGIGESAPETLVEMSSTSPYLTLHNTEESDSWNARKCRITAKGEQSGGEETTLGYFEFAHNSGSDDQKGRMRFYINSGTDGNSPKLHSLWTSNGIYLYGIDSSYPQFTGYTYSSTNWHAYANAAYKAGGTQSSPTAIGSGDVIFSYDCFGYDGAAYKTAAKFSIETDGAISSGVVPMKIGFRTGESGSSPIERLVIKATGYIGLNEASPETVIELTNASPFFTFHCSTETDEADSGICKLLFKREQSNGTESTHAAIYAAHDGASADQKGYIALCTNDGSDGNVPTERVRIDSAGLVDVIGNFTAGTIQADNGFTGSFTNGVGDTVTVVGGMITDVS